MRQGMTRMNHDELFIKHSEFSSLLQLNVNLTLQQAVEAFRVVRRRCFNPTSNGCYNYYYYYCYYHYYYFAIIVLHK